MALVLDSFDLKIIVYINQNIMSSLLYLIALVLIIGWLLGVFVYSVGGLIHILLVLALVVLVVQLVTGRRAV